jgi:hypothetical protein
MKRFQVFGCGEAALYHIQDLISFEFLVWVCKVQFMKHENTGMQ